MYNFLQSASYAVYGIGGGAGDKSSDLNDFLRMKRKVLHCERAHLKVPGWLLV